MDSQVVGHTQQRLRQTHQSHTFFGGQPVLGQELFHNSGARAAADAAHQFGRPSGDRHPGVIGELGLSNQSMNNLILARQVVVTDGLANVMKLWRHGLLWTHGGYPPDYWNAVRILTKPLYTIYLFRPELVYLFPFLGSNYEFITPNSGQ